MARRIPQVTLRAWAGFALIVALTVGAGYGVHRQLDQATDVRQAVQTTGDRIDRLSGLLVALLDIETGHRGYIITGDARYLEPYRAGRSRIATTLRAIERDAASEDTKVRYRHLLRLVEAKLAYTERTIRLRDREGLTDAVAVVGRGEGKRLMDAIRTEIAAMVRIERARLAQRSAAAKAQETRSRQVIDVALATALATTLAIGLMLLFQLRRRLSAEREVRRWARLLQTTLDNVGVGTAVIDGRGRILVRNAELLRLVPEAETTDAPATLAEELALARDGKPFLVERAIGPAAAVIVRGVCLSGGRFLVTLLDVSEARQAERVKSEFVSTVSHELRTPVTSVRGALGMLAGPLAKDLPEKHRSLVDLAMRNADRLTLLVNDILDIEKIESGRMEFAMEATDVNRLLRDAAETNRAYADARDVTLALGTLARPLLIWADPHRVQQVMANLISNAVKFSEPGGIVTVTAEPAGDAARIVVHDMGPGVPEAFRSRIFERFAQADAGDARAKAGTGLGLSIAKAIVEKHSGELDFESQPGDTRFHFTVPLCSSDTSAAAQPSRTPQETS